jgi:hypothetical protein
MIPVQVCSSLDVPEAQQWTEVDTSKAHPKLIHFPLKGTLVTNLKAKQKYNLFQFLSHLLDGELIGIRLDDKICLSVPIETYTNN